MNFTVFSIPYVMHVHITSLCTVNLVKCLTLGRGWRCVQ